MFYFLFERVFTVLGLFFIVRILGSDPDPKKGRILARIRTKYILVLKKNTNCSSLGYQKKYLTEYIGKQVAYIYLRIFCKKQDPESFFIGFDSSQNVWFEHSRKQLKVCQITVF